MEINLKKYKADTGYKVQGKNALLCKIREKLIIEGDEEIIRQNFIEYMVDKLNFSKRNIKVEIPISYYKKRVRGRADIIVNDHNDNPFLLIECKKFNKGLDTLAKEQLAGYNKYINAQYLLLTNGKDLEVYQNDNDKLKKIEVKNLEELIQNKKFDTLNDYGVDFQRFELDLKKHKKNLLPYSKKEKLFGLTTNDEKRIIALKLINLFLDFTDNSPKLKKLNSKKAKLVRDGGVRLSTYGNALGFDYFAPYRYLVLNKNGEDIIVSFSVFSGGYIDYTYLMVGIDNFDKTHHSLQLKLDDHLEINNDLINITHDGTITSGKKGRLKNIEVLKPMKKEFPDLIFEETVKGEVKEKIKLGQINASKNSYYFDDEEIIDLISNLVDYALLRDEIRKGTI